MALKGKLSIVAGDVIATVKFDRACKNEPIVVTSPASITAGCLLSQPFVTTTPTGFTLSISAAGLLKSGITYTWNYVVA